MSPIEIEFVPEGQPDNPLRFRVTNDIGSAVNHQEDGSITVFTVGQISDGGQVVPGEVSIRISGEITESFVWEDMEQRGIRVPPAPSEALKTETSSPTEHVEREDGNELFEFTGNPVYDAKAWKTSRGKRVAEFVLATNPTEDDPGYKRIRAFDGLAAYVEKHVRQKQTGVKVAAYGEKQWTHNGKEVSGYYAKSVKVPKRYTSK